MRWLIYGMLALVLGVVAYAMWPASYVEPPRVAVPMQQQSPCGAALATISTRLNEAQKRAWQERGERLSDSYMIEWKRETFSKEHPECATEFPSFFK